MSENLQEVASSNKPISKDQFHMSLLDLDKSDFDRIDGFALDGRNPRNGMLDRFEIFSAMDENVFKDSPEKQKAVETIDQYMSENFELGLNSWHSENFARAELLGDFELVDGNGDKVLSESELSDKDVIDKLSPMDKQAAQILKSRFRELADATGGDGSRGIADWRDSFKADQFQLFEPANFSDLNWATAPSRGL